MQIEISNWMILHVLREHLLYQMTVYHVSRVAAARAYFY